MKKCTLVILLLFTYAAIKAQDYKISFAGKGTSTTVGTVKVENLTQSKSVSLLGSEVLHLVATSTGIDPILENENALHIYPNPTNGNSTIDFVASASGKASIELFDITGKRVAAVQNNLTIGSHSYQVSSLRSGIYTVKIYSLAYTYTGKLVNNGISGSEVKIRYIGNSVIPFADQKLKNASTEKLMQYTIGDRLKFTGTSGIYSTIMTDIPTQSKTLTFTFVACTDGDGNNYSVVQIGTQTWMIENLKTTKLSDGTSISDLNTTNPGYCWYNFDIKYKNIFGALYNWYTIKTGKLTPIGWHVPTYVEWDILLKYLYDNLGTLGPKALASNTYWKSSGNSNAVGNDLTKNNSSGFTALPAGGRTNDGTFYGINTYKEFITEKIIIDHESCGWWSSSDINNSAAVTDMRYDSSTFFGGGELKGCAMSVRCVKD